mgnify:CR=1 FL=1
MNLQIINSCPGTSHRLSTVETDPGRCYHQTDVSEGSATKVERQTSCDSS